MTLEMVELSQAKITEDRFKNVFYKIKHGNKITHFVVR